jgi:uncharacterized HhH-GPD family protein
MPTPSGCPSLAAPAEPSTGAREKPRLPVTGDAEADDLLVDDPFALLVGMLVDQQFPLERAFAAPALLRRRLGADHFSAIALAALDPADVEAAFAGPPALHRFPVAMAARTCALARHLVARHHGRAEDVWLPVADAEQLYDRVRALPGFGDEKSKIFIALLGKRLGVRPRGWERVSQPFSDAEPRSVADIGSREAFERVKAWKRERRAQGKSKQE